jgi:hypothetical protein
MLTHRAKYTSGLTITRKTKKRRSCFSLPGFRHAILELSRDLASLRSSPFFLYNKGGEKNVDPLDKGAIDIIAIKRYRFWLINLVDLFDPIDLVDKLEKVSAIPGEYLSEAPFGPLAIRYILQGSGNIFILWRGSRQGT